MLLLCVCVLFVLLFAFSFFIHGAAWYLRFVLNSLSLSLSLSLCLSFGKETTSIYTMSMAFSKAVGSAVQTDNCHYQHRCYIYLCSCNVHRRTDGKTACGAKTQNYGHSLSVSRYSGILDTDV